MVLFLLYFTSEFIPTITNIKKNKMAQNGDKGIRLMASGYAMKANPGPLNTDKILFTQIYYIQNANFFQFNCMYVEIFHREWVLE